MDQIPESSGYTPSTGSKSGGIPAWVIIIGGAVGVCAVVTICGILLVMIVLPAVMVATVDSAIPGLEETLIAEVENPSGGVVVVEPVEEVPVEAVPMADGLAQSRYEENGVMGFAIGDENAPVTIVEYMDFSCPHCHNLSREMLAIIDQYVYSGEVRIVYKLMTFLGPQSEVAAQAAICAGNQGHFWEMQEYIWSVFEQSGPSGYTEPQLSGGAEALGLDMALYTGCLDSASTWSIISEVYTEFGDLGLTGVPAVFVNGEQVNFTGNGYLEDLQPVIESWLEQ